MVGSGAARVRPRHRLTLTTTVLALTAALASSVGWCPVARAADPYPAAAVRPLAPPPPAGPPAVPVPGAVPPAPALDPAAGLALLTAAGEAAARARGTVQVAVRGPSGAEVLTGPDAGSPVLTASLVKLLVVQQLFARDAAGSLQLSPGDLDRMRRAIVSSDDGAMSVLWDRFDGEALVLAAAAEFGLTGSAPPARAGQWGEAVTTAADTALFLSALPDHLPADDLATLTGWMGFAAPIATDGFDQRYGLLAPEVTATTAVAVKQGWICCIDARRQLHSAGILADGRVVVLLGDFPTSTSWTRARAALDAAAAAVVAGT
ncbi:Beta-lactamase [Modestobacter italicus]|uniref:Beta-lactamase n=1 Tax=Modestobacter italicus (strain DSM 44449 / CECT 9708 / BC 501) TaxID=2732864 RepID=I4EXH9_MODI5|nr:hypothetical protein [Modestobacter marinus]CCH88092.1 Beta-lactamase [Modestobacter marinus]